MIISNNSNLVEIKKSNSLEYKHNSSTIRPISNVFDFKDPSKVLLKTKSKKKEISHATAFAVQDERPLTADSLKNATLKPSNNSNVTLNGQRRKTFAETGLNGRSTAVTKAAAAALPSKPKSPNILIVNNKKALLTVTKKKEKLESLLRNAKSLALGTAVVAPAKNQCSSRISGKFSNAGTRVKTEMTTKTQSQGKGSKVFKKKSTKYVESSATVAGGDFSPQIPVKPFTLTPEPPASTASTDIHAEWFGPKNGEKMDFKQLFSQPQTQAQTLPQIKPQIQPQDGPQTIYSSIASTPLDVPMKTITTSTTNLSLTAPLHTTATSTTTLHAKKILDTPTQRPSAAALESFATSLEHFPGLVRKLYSNDSLTINETFEVVHQGVKLQDKILELVARFNEYVELIKQVAEQDC